LFDYGFRVVVSSDIADIFKSNCLKNGVLPVTVPPEIHSVLLAEAGYEVTINLNNQTLRVGKHQCSFNIEPFARHCLLQGVDALGALRQYLPAIETFEKNQRPQP